MVELMVSDGGLEGKRLEWTKHESQKMGQCRQYPGPAAQPFHKLLPRDRMTAFMFLKMERPCSTAATMDEKLSFANTSKDRLAVLNPLRCFTMEDATHDVPSLPSK